MKKFAFLLCCVLCAGPRPVYADGAPQVAARAAVLMEAESGRVLWGKEMLTPLPMASTTKIMTAVLALESGRMDETVTVSAKAAAAPKVKMFLARGEKARLGDLLLALMLESSNDAAVAIAEHLSEDGSVAGFCAGMTQKARAIGAKDTLFLTPNGLDYGHETDADGKWHHTTAYDMALITRYALRVPGFVELTNTPAASFETDRRAYHFNNLNRLLREYAGANGVKTGFTGQAGHCFVGAAKRDDMQLISVVLASGWGQRGKAQKWVDTKAALTYGFDHYAFETLVARGDKAGDIPVTRARETSVDCVYASGLRLPLNQREKETVRVERDLPAFLPAPITQGDRLGAVTVTVGDDAYEVALTALCDIARHDLPTSIKKVLAAWLIRISD